MSVSFRIHRGNAADENTNGLLRQYFPKDNLSTHSAAYLDEVAAELNSRPRNASTGIASPESSTG
jgi:IS30 family transposase